MDVLEPRSSTPRRAPPRTKRLNAEHRRFASSPFHRVLWAIDASTLDSDSGGNAALAVLPALAPDASVLPVYALDPEGLNWLGENSHDRTEFLRPAAAAALENAVRDAIMTESRPRQWFRPWIIELNEVPLAGLEKRLARKLLSRAARLNIDLILVQHRKRTGLRRWLKTCFTEHLLNEGDRPLLVTGPRAPKHVERIDRVIFATNFSPACRTSFEVTLRLAKFMGVPVRLIHKPAPPTDPIVHSGALILGGSWISLPGLSESLAHLSQSEGQSWIDHAKTLEIPADFVFDDSGEGLAATLASICAADTSPLLVMTAATGTPLHSGPWGSVTRDVLDEVPCPVLVLRG